MDFDIDQATKREIIIYYQSRFETLQKTNVDSVDIKEIIAIFNKLKSKLD